jgi:prepilin-type N-terminal cleavage/methylation domain-containing protein
MGADQLPRRLTRAFTLRELLVTVSVLALLALIVAPGPLQLQRREAQLVTCADRLGRISQAVAACFAENNGYGPTATRPASC